MKMQDHPETVLVICLHLLKQVVTVPINKKINANLTISFFFSFRLIGLWEKPINNNISAETGSVTWYYRMYGVLVMGSLIVYAVTIALDITEPKTYSSLVILGDDMCVICGVCFYTK